MSHSHKLSTSNLKSLTYKSFLVFILALLPSLAQAAISKKAWKSTPSKQNWSAFFAMNEAQQAKEWSLIKSYGLAFDELSWEWRLGWVRACSTAKSKDCGNIMQLGLFDKALVVRAESATRLGQRFAKTGHAPAIRLLRTAYAVQQNTRSKEPMFVQYRILGALNQIGGEGIAVGRQLSLNSSRTSQYWTRIASK